MPARDKVAKGSGSSKMRKPQVADGVDESISPYALDAEEGVASTPCVNNSIGMLLAQVPAGSATLHGPRRNKSTGKFKDSTRKEVFYRAFLMGVFPVTQSEYSRVMGNSQCSFSGERLPVEQVSWHEAEEFCRRLTLLPEEIKAGREYRLPSIEEWEYACRAGSQGAYCFGDDRGKLAEYAWYGKEGGNSEGASHPVGEKLPNSWGIYDMHGNVWEWCETKSSEQMVDLATGQKKVEYFTMGGSYYHEAWRATCSSSEVLYSTTRTSYTGLRVVANLTQETRAARVGRTLLGVKCQICGGESSLVLRTRDAEWIADQDLSDGKTQKSLSRRLRYLTPVEIGSLAHQVCRDCQIRMEWA